MITFAIKAPEQPIPRHSKYFALANLQPPAAPTHQGHASSQALRTKHFARVSVLLHSQTTAFNNAFSMTAGPDDRKIFMLGEARDEVFAVQAHVGRDNYHKVRPTLLENRL